MNQTSKVGNVFLLDTLISRGMNVVKIFAPEHGFRGRADAGAHVDDEKDSTTGLSIISLYGDNKKPRKNQLDNVDIVVYDIQDVGVRFYTYISTLQYVMEACADNDKPLLVLDRPNPNGFYIAGPVLDTAMRSFVGMQRIPLVYGMTPGEYAQMLKGMRWIKNAEKLNLKVLRCDRYTHSSRYELPVPPSPNLKTASSVYYYPSVCLFEGTVVSVGRGTNNPFEQWGAPEYKGKASYKFVPVSMNGATKPPYQDKECYGMKLPDYSKEAQKPAEANFTLQWLIKAYNWYPDKEKFFNSFFEKLAGTATLRKQIESGMTEEQIRATWQKDIEQFKKIRKRYLLYRDFE